MFLKKENENDDSKKEKSSSLLKKQGNLLDKSDSEKQQLYVMTKCEIEVLEQTQKLQQNRRSKEVNLGLFQSTSTEDFSVSKNL